MEIFHVYSIWYTTHGHYINTLYLQINPFRCLLYNKIQIMTSVSVLSCFKLFLEYRDNDSGLRLSSYPYMIRRA